MRPLQLALGLVVMAGLVAILASPAMSAPRTVVCVERTAKTGKWENSLCTKGAKEGDWETNELVGTGAVTGSGTVELEDAKEETALKCSGSGSGWVANPSNRSEPSEGGLTTVKATSCTTLKGTCEKPNARAINLPWGGRLVERGSEVRGESVSGPKKEEGKGEPGWAVECTVDGIIKVTDTCEHQGNTGTGRANRENGSVEAEADERTKEETMGTCSVGGEGAQLGRGLITSKMVSGTALWLLAAALKT
jgi:hypothetical protein